jgi:dynein heavy chain
MTVTLWNRTQTKMLPTPAKFHYLFNMRELSKVFQGVILAERDRFNKACKAPMYGGTVNSPEGYLLALWVHECRRVFADKLIDLQDKAWVDKTINDLCRQEFPAELCKQASGWQLQLWHSGWAAVNPATIISCSSKLLRLID